MIATTFWSPDGTPMSAAQFVERLFGELPAFFKDEDQLRQIWSNPETREKLLQELAEKGFGDAQLSEIKHIISADDSDIYDVLAYIAFAKYTITRAERVQSRKSAIDASYDEKQRDFIDFVLTQYIGEGVGELAVGKLPDLIELKYQSTHDAVQVLGSVQNIRNVFIGFQEILSPSIRQIKERMTNGDLGKIHSIKLKGGWPRPDSYYTRNDWAGKLRSGTDWILDGPAHNAMAHYLNNMFYVASSEPAKSAVPVSIQAELYRARPIETYDTVCLRAKLDTGADLYFYASHCSETEFHPEMSIITDKASIIRKFENGATTIHYHDGHEEYFDDGATNPRREVFVSAIGTLQGKPEHYCSL